MNIVKKELLYIYIIMILIIGLVLIFFLHKSFAATIENHSEVREESVLTYYLTIDYDGKDINKNQSSNTTVAEINSDEIIVQDKIPEGLTFVGFVTTSDGTIGATNRNNNTLCPGRVIDDTQEESLTEGSWNNAHTEYTYHGLHYDETTRIVSFRIKNVKAGCRLTVGIKTKTPEIDDTTTQNEEIRRDFYNYTLSRENNWSTLSNLTHTYMGDNSATLHKVTYEYEGDVPDGAPDAPEETQYIALAKVGVNLKPYVEGYNFVGWTSNDVTITNERFTMPNSNVVLKGSFTPKTKYTVTYIIEGDKPSNYTPPPQKEYSVDQLVSLDSIIIGNSYDNYVFNGWTSSDVTISEDNNFTMPSNNVQIKGSFTGRTYSVSYKFTGVDLPPNYESLLPTTKQYIPGTKVELEDNPVSPENYQFKGWLKDDQFTMPNSNVIIYGVWEKTTNEYDLEITKEIVDSKSSYMIGDIVKSKITIKNIADHTVHTIMVKDEGTIVSNDESYSKLSNHYASIYNITAGNSVEIMTNYQVSPNDSNIVTKTATIKGALSEEGDILGDRDYSASISFNVQPKIQICNITDGLLSKTFQFSIKDETNGFESWISILDNGCKTIYLAPSNYIIQEIVPQEYKITKVNGETSKKNNIVVNIEGGNDYNISFTNEFVKKGFYHSSDRKELMISSS